MTQTFCLTPLAGKPAKQMVGGCGAKLKKKCSASLMTRRFTKICTVFEVVIEQEKRAISLELNKDMRMYWYEDHASSFFL